MDEKSYIPESDIEKSTPLDGYVPVLVGELKGADVYDAKTVFVRASSFPQSGISTITPVITVGTGTCTDVTISFIRVGDRVHFEFYTRTLVIPIGESAITLTVDLTGTGFEPATDFSLTTDVFGIARPANVVSGANEMSSSSIESDLPKKIKIDVALTANASGADFAPAVTGSGSYSIL